MPENKDKSYRIAEDIIRMIERGHTPDDLASYPDLKEYIETNAFALDLLEELSSPEAYRVANDDKERDVARLVGELQRRRRQKRRLTLRIGMAAAVCGAVAAILFWPAKENSPALSALPDRETKPVFISNDGRRVTLDGREENIDLAKYRRDQTEAMSQDDTHQEIFNQIIVPAMNMLSVTLPDGSEVVLNAESSLKYSAEFGTGDRDVDLTGEAYFKITRSDVPFRIKMGDAYAKVYGTEFNAEHRQGVMSAVMLVNGSVSFGAGGEEIAMQPGELCRYSAADGNISLSQADAGQFTGWLNNLFRYDNIPVADLFAKLAGWYGVEFIFDPLHLEGLGVFVSSSRDVPLEQLLEMIAESAGVIFDIIAPDKINVKAIKI